MLAARCPIPMMKRSLSAGETRQETSVYGAPYKMRGAEFFVMLRDMRYSGRRIRLNGSSDLVGLCRFFNFSVFSGVEQKVLPSRFQLIPPAVKCQNIARCEDGLAHFLLPSCVNNSSYM